MDVNQKVQEIKDKIQNYPVLHINKVPRDTFLRFKEIADTDHMKDYGLTLKYLIDIHDGILKTGVEHLEMAILDLNNRVQELEIVKDKETPQSKVIKMANGKIIQR
jgi:hypothetical protein